MVSSNPIILFSVSSSPTVLEYYSKLSPILSKFQHLLFNSHIQLTILSISPRMLKN